MAMNRMLDAPWQENGNRYRLLEQSEPLDLCVNGETSNVIIEVSSDSKLFNSLSGEDLLPVKESSTQVVDNEIKPAPVAPTRRNPTRQIKIPKRFEDFCTEELREVEEEIRNAQVGLVATVVTSEKSEDKKLKTLATKNNNIMKNKSAPGARINVVRRGQNKENLEPKGSFQDLIPFMSNNMSLLKKFAKDVSTRNHSMNTRKKSVDEEKITFNETSVKEIRAMITTQSILTHIVRQMDPSGLSESINDS